MKKAPRRVGVVENTWKPQYQAFRFRYKLFALAGPSMLGKTEYVNSFHGPDRTLIVDCSNCDDPNLHDFDYIQHLAVCFDECNASTAIKYKKLASRQARLT